ncbi:AAA family ATPase [Longispora sp. NPDC051575]|uniref:ATP-binding protein n=1 Tax=Longispora sp. NPDC051575 TaxID=3154943 RepID=UPI0034192428
MALIEREHELAAIAARLDAAADGHGGVLLVEGPPGIGKTALLAAAGAHARAAGVRALGAVGGELDRELPFSVVRQLFEPVLRSVAPTERAELTAGAASLAGPVFEAPTAGADPDQLGDVVHGLYWLCSNLTEAGPLLLAVDDVHWIDDASGRFLSHLARRITDLPVLLLAAGRPGRSFDGFVGGALGGTQPELLRPRALSPAGVGALVRHDLAADAEDEFCTACARASGGNPFLLTEALRSLRAEGAQPVAAEAWRLESLRPDTVARAVLTRIARLGPQARNLTRALAVLGPSADLRHTAGLAGLAVDRAAELADLLAREAIVGPGRPLDFTHPLVRTAVYADSSEVLRAAEHKRAARVLAGDGRAPGALAPHLLLAEPAADPWVVDTLRAAAHAASARGAPESAAACLNRALREPPVAADTGPLHAELGRVLGLAHRPDESAAAYRRALELTEAPLDRIGTALDFGFAMLRAGRADRTVEAFELAYRAIDRDPADLPLPLISWLAGAGLLTMRPPAVIIAVLDRVAPRLSPERTVDRSILASLAFAAAATGDRPAAEVVRLARLAVSGPLPDGEQSVLLGMAAGALSMSGMHQESLDLIDRGLDVARGLGALAAYQFMMMLRSHQCLFAGRLAEAEGDARAATDTEPGTAGRPNPEAAATLVNALTARGRLGDAQRALTAGGLEEGHEIGVLINHFGMIARGRLRLRQLRSAEALADLAGCGAALAGRGYLNPGFAPWRIDAALAAHALGRAEEATALAAENLRLARAFGAAEPVCAALRVCGLLTGGPAGLGLLEEAVAHADTDYARAQTLVEYGAALRRAGLRARAGDPLRQALDAATRSGADGLATRAAEELRAMGLRPRRPMLTGRDSLTAGELRVATLAADGATNREIAQLLFLTRRTVEVHLTSTYRKLEIDSRGALRGALDPRS